MPSLSEGLQGLPVFEGVPDQERQRALLQAGLAMMQPHDPLSGSPLTQLTGGINAGLQSLDAQRAERTAADARAFDQGIALRGANVDERGAAVGEQQANTAQASAEAQATNAKGTLEQSKLEWTEGGTNREAQAALNSAKAKYYDRMPEAGGSSTASDLMIQKHLSKLNSMWAIDKALPITEQRFHSKSDPRLIDEAWGALTLREGSSVSDSLGVIARTTPDAAETGQKLLAATDPNAALGRVPPTPAELQSAEQMAQWSKAQWEAILNGPDNPEINRLLLKFPGVRARANVLLAE